MKYLVAVDDCFLDVPGGMGRVAWDIALVMRDHGHDVSLICAGKSPNVPAVQQAEGIRIVRYAKPVLSKWHPLVAHRNIRAAAKTARDVLAAERWDVAHIHSTFTGLGVIRVLGAGPRYVYTMHSPMVLEQRINWSSQGWAGRLKLLFGQEQLRKLEGEALKPCAAIHTLSHFTKTQVEHFHGLGDRVTVIPHWRRRELKREYSKQQARELLGWPADAKILFTLRGHVPRNGLDIGIRAVAPLAREDKCWFMIGGGGRLRPALEKLAADLGVSHRIKFLGRIPDEQLNLAYQAADLFLLPTLALECFGLITLEAFAFGCPVLSTDAGAIPETMIPIMPEFVVPAGDVRALHDKLEAFLLGRLVPPSPEQLVNYTRERFDPSVVIPSFLKLLGHTSCPTHQEAGA